MNPLPHPLSNGPVVGWRLDELKHAATWDTREGAFKVGGRWNSKGIRAVYASLDPATSIVEVAVHKGFNALDTVPHVLTSFEVIDHRSIHVVVPAAVPNRNWLVPGTPSAGQQNFGDALLAKHLFVAIPSAVSSFSWNLIFDADRADSHYKLLAQTPFALDTRLNSPRR